MIDKTEWLVVQNGFYTASGHDTVIAAFRFKYEAKDWLGPINEHWKNEYSIIRRKKS